MKASWWSQIPQNIQYNLIELGFDPDFMESLRQAVLKGDLSAEKNHCFPPLKAPESEDFLHLPSHDSQDYRYYYELGCHALAAGKIGVAILNGGMATRLGGVVKGAEIVDHGRSFLQLKLDDVREWQDRLGGHIPVFLVDSFATDTATKEHLQHETDVEINYLQQGVGLRLTTTGAVFFDEHGEPSLYAPGHGDMLRAWRASSVAMDWCREDGRILLIGNVDNLFYSINPAIIGILINQRGQLVAEAVAKLPHDMGGAPVWYQGRLQTIEGFRFPPGYDQHQVPVFSTNSFAVRAEVMTKEWDLDWFYVLKEAHGQRLVQLEKLVNQLTAFVKTTFLVVPRTGIDGRFMAVKTVEDMAKARTYFNEGCLIH